ncbi:hypothetical protein IFM89_036948 [Coptis chinensis]|uniref:F-box domain-containing protein n=1 Tax=Coptis chinensis TaxID=261450 RepID=A0A835HI05_9MAGN|nr:hypothetical protein IFM89_036948 [Coptis chinensis]
MDISQSENKKNYESRSSSSPQYIHDMISSLKVGEELVEPAQPHEALVLVLSYLNLFELLRMSQVCKSLRDAIESDILLWLDIVVEPPLNSRINDDNLLKCTSKAQGRLRSLVLPSCVKITDDGLLRVIQNNPHINKVYAFYH